MTNQTYYVSWSTWKEQQVETPWDFWFISQGTRYKPRQTCDSKLVPGAAMIAHAFQTQNQKLLDEIGANFINDIKLLAFIPALDPQHAQQQVQMLFEDAEFDRVCVVDQQQQQTILQLITSAMAKASVVG